MKMTGGKKADHAMTTVQINMLAGFNPTEKSKQGQGYECNCQMEELDGVLYFWDSWENDTHTCPPLFFPPAVLSVPGPGSRRA